MRGREREKTILTIPQGSPSLLLALFLASTSFSSFLLVDHFVLGNLHTKILKLTLVEFNSSITKLHTTDIRCILSVHRDIVWNMMKYYRKIF